MVLRSCPRSPRRRSTQSAPRMAWAPPGIMSCPVAAASASWSSLPEVVELAAPTHRRRAPAGALAQERHSPNFEAQAPEAAWLLQTSAIPMHFTMQLFRNRSPADSPFAKSTAHCAHWSEIESFRSAHLPTPSLLTPIKVATFEHSSGLFLNKPSCSKTLSMCVRSSSVQGLAALIFSASGSSVAPILRKSNEPTLGMSLKPSCASGTWML
mmetsp:Transcript_30400/g.87112  ORF Transcript_30400/g.87112 Transcript_30400/m.87112 type:complete len:211 (+) Transcript_30400:526-1158(+)